MLCDILKMTVKVPISKQLTETKNLKTKKMKLHFCLLVLFLTACFSKNKEQSSSGFLKELGDIDCLDCYFYLFDKYKQDYDSIELENWKAQVAEELISGNDLKEYSVFNRKGGGPMGAHWNSDASLFCVTKLSKVSAIEINGNPTNIQLGQKHTLNCFSIQSAEWTKVLKNISTEDYAKIYAEESNSSEEENSQIGVGQTLQITIKDEANNVCIKMFHIAFGE